MKYKSSKLKKPRNPERKRGSWLQNLGSILTGIAAILKVTFEVVKWLLDR